MPTLAAPQTATYTTTSPNESVNVICTGATDCMLVSWVGPAGTSGQRMVRNTTAAGEDIGPLLDNTSVTFAAMAGAPSYTAPAFASPVQALVSGAGNQTVVADAVLSLANYPVGNVINSAAGGATKLQLGVPATGGGEFRVRNADKLSDTAVYLQHAQPAIRLSNSGSSIQLPSVTLSATADVGWTVAALVRVHSVNTQAGTTHYAFLKIGSGSAYFLLGYEGPNATNPGCLKALMPNAAANGLASVRSNSSPSPTYAAFAPGQIGQWIWVFVRKHGAQLIENVLSLSTGAEISATFVDETVTLAWAPVLSPSATGTQVYAGSTGIASGAYSAANAALIVGPDDSTTGACDVAKVMVLAGTCLTQAQMREIAKGYAPQDIGITVNNSTDVYYDLTSTTAASLLDLLGGTAASSVTLAGSDAATPVANRPTVLQRIGSTGIGWLQGSFTDGTGYKDGALA